ncbi:MAG: M56 family metallopeptidase [Verrucomicrobiales bacterium]|nr:M56 family metallopeptidase [Verrucomicrobiales bacterium]
MSTLLQWFDTPAWQTLVRSFGHSLWAGTVITLLAVILVWSIPTKWSNLRYLLALSAQLLIPLLTVVVWALLFHSTNVPRTSTDTFLPAPVEATPSPATVKATQTPAVQNPIPEKITSAFRWSPLICLLWISGALFFLTILFRDSRSAADLVRKRSDAARRVEFLEPLLSELKQKIGITSEVSLRSCGQIIHPAVTGFLKRVILIPADLPDNSSTKMWSVILAHELAHIKRYDYQVNLIQRVCESILFFNPAVWFLGNLTREEREAACDLLASRAVSDHRETYVEGVAEWIQITTETTGRIPAPLMSMAGQRSSGISARMKRILFPTHRPTPTINFSSVLLSVLVVGIALWSIHGVSIRAADILTGAERARISSSLRAETPPAIKRTDPYELKINIRDEQGEPFEKAFLDKLVLSLNVTHENSSLSTNLSNHQNFTRKIEAGVSQIHYFSPKWVPVSTPSMAPEPGKAVVEHTITLKKGTDAYLRVLNEAGAPIGNLDFNLVLGGRGHHRKVTSNNEGTVTLQLDEPAEFSLYLWDKNYAWCNIDSIKMGPRETTEVTIPDSDTFTLTILDETTGRPIANAEIRKAREFNYAHRPLGTTDRDGRVKIHQMTSNQNWDLCVISPEGHRAFLTDISPYHGENQTSQIPAPRRLSGKLDLTQLAGVEPDTSGRYPLKITGGTSWKKRQTNGWWETALTEPAENGTANFRIENLWPGRLTLSAGNAEWRTPDIDSETEPVVLSASTPKTTPPNQREKLGERDIVIDFKAPQGTEPWDGDVKVSNYGINGWEHTKQKVEAGKMHLRDAPVYFPLTIEISPDWSDGFWFPEKRIYISKRNEIPPKDEAIRAEIAIVEAGGIKGKILESNGTPASDLLISIRHVPGEGEDKLRGLPSIKNSSHRHDQISEFFAAPLPLGYWYRLHIYRKNTRVASEPIFIDQNNPFGEATFQFAPGVSVSGRVLDSGGKPAAGQTVQLIYTAPEGGTFSDEGIETQFDGIFQFEGVNLDTPGSYHLKFYEDESGYHIPVTADNHSEIILKR